MSGSGAGGGFHFQALVTAYVSAHILGNRPLRWGETTMVSCPIAVSAESSSGNDLHVHGQAGALLAVEVKRGLRADDRLWDAVAKMARHVARDARHYGALVVDPSASGTVRSALAGDLRRLADGRADRLKMVGAEFQRRLREQGHDPHLIAKRLALVVLDEAADSRYVLELLRSHVGTTPASSVWSLLQKDALELISRRGRRDLAALRQLLRSVQPDLATTALTSSLSYEDWLRPIAGTFAVPGLGSLRLPIAVARFRVLPLVDSGPSISVRMPDATITAIEVGENPEVGNEVTDIGELPRRLVLMGSPGAGKSTLLRKLTHRCLETGRSVWWVRAPLLVRYLLRGAVFVEALVRAAGDGRPMAELSDAPPPDVLLIDGLDECYQYRSELATALLRWERGHEAVHLVVSTRRAGHDPSLFAGWEERLLLPLSRDDVRHFADVVFRALGQERSAEDFVGKVDAAGVTTLAARNPLLLGISIASYLDRKELARDRAGILEQLIERLRTHPVHDREPVDEAPAALSRRVLHAVAWRLLDEPQATRLSVIESVAAELCGRARPTLSDLEMTERVVAMWEQRRLLETQTVGGEQLLTFVHLSLAEFAAACAVTQLAPDELTAWLTRVGRLSRWREVIVAAATRAPALGLAMLARLVQLQDPDDPCSTEALSAASLLVALRVDGGAVAETLVASLARLLTAAVPLRAFEAHDQLLALLPLSPERVRRVVSPLVKSAQHWTRLCAVHLLLASGAGAELLAAAEPFIVDVVVPLDEDGRRKLSFVYDEAERDIYPLLIERYCRVLLAQDDQARLAWLEALLSPHLDDLDIAVRHGFRVLDGTAMMQRLNERNLQRVLRTMPPLADPPAERSSDRFVLQSIARVCGAPLAPRPPADPSVIRILLAAMGWRAHDRSWAAVATSIAPPLWDAMLRSTIESTGLPTNALAAAAADALAALEQTDGDVQSSLLQGLSDPDAPVDWARAAKLAPDAELLLQALAHPLAPVADVAADLLVYGAGGSQADERLQRALQSDDAALLARVASIAVERWGRHAIPLFVQRLERPISYAMRVLLQPLAEMMRLHGERSWPLFLRALRSTDRRVATAAAEALATFGPIPADVLVVVDAELDRDWPSRDADGRTIRQHTPTMALLRILHAAGAIDQERCLQLLGHPIRWVVTFAVRELAKTAGSEELRRALQQVAVARHKLTILEELCALSAERLSALSDDFVTLFATAEGWVRGGLLSLLKSASWMPRESKLLLCKAGITDPDPSARSCAAHLLRRLD